MAPAVANRVTVVGVVPPVPVSILPMDKLFVAVCSVTSPVVRTDFTFTPSASAILTTPLAVTVYSSTRVSSERTEVLCVELPPMSPAASNVSEVATMRVVSTPSSSIKPDVPDSVPLAVNTT